MNSRATKHFWRLYYALPQDVQNLADKSYALWFENPGHPSVQFKLVDADESLYSARISRQYRALGVLRGNTITWFWIGKHDIYDRILK